jgi:hypothetical protein
MVREVSIGPGARRTLSIEYVREIEQAAPAELLPAVVDVVDGLIGCLVQGV